MQGASGFSSRETSLAVIGGSNNYYDEALLAQGFRVPIKYPWANGEGFVRNALLINNTLDGTSVAYRAEGSKKVSPLYTPLGVFEIQQGLTTPSKGQVHGSSMYACIGNCTVQGNRHYNLTVGTYYDSWRGRDLVVRDNLFRNVEVGFFFNFGSNVFHEQVYVINNTIDLVPITTNVNRFHRGGAGMGIGVNFLRLHRPFSVDNASIINNTIRIYDPRLLTYSCGNGQRRGDLNGDGLINEWDEELGAPYYAQNMNPSSCCYDLNGDGVATSVDATMLAHLVRGTASFPTPGTCTSATPYTPLVLPSAPDTYGIIWSSSENLTILNNRILLPSVSQAIPRFWSAVSDGSSAFDCRNNLNSEGATLPCVLYDSVPPLLTPVNPNLTGTLVLNGSFIVRSDEELGEILYSLDNGITKEVLIKQTDNRTYMASIPASFIPGQTGTIRYYSADKAVLRAPGLTGPNRNDSVVRSFVAVEGADNISPVLISIPANININYLDSVNVIFSASDNRGSVSYYVNDSRFNISQNGLLTNKSALGTQIYRVNVSVNDSSNNYNSTTYQVTVNRINSSVSLLLNGVSGNLGIISGEGALVNAGRLIGEGNVSLIVDGIEVNNSLSILHKLNITALGNHSVNVSHAHTQNYSANSSVLYIEVREALDSISPIFTSIPSNLSLNYGAGVNVIFSASDNRGSVSYYVNDSRFNISQNGLLTNKSALGSGKYEIQIKINDSAGNFNLTNYRIDVADELSPIIMLANGLRQNLTLTYGSTVNISVNVNGFTLLRNGSDVTNDAGKNILLNVGNYNFTVVKNQFFSALNVNVEKASQTITFNSISDKKYGQVVDLIASSSSGLPVIFEVVSGENFVSPITGSFLAGEDIEYDYFNVALNIIKKAFIREQVLLSPTLLPGNRINLTGVGSVTIIASQPGNNNYLPAQSVDRTFNVQKGDATIIFSNLNNVYNGSAKTVGASTIPSGLGVTITYTGLATLPVNAGAYPFSAVINDNNYQGSGNSVLVITQAEQSITFNEISNKSVGEEFNLVASSSSFLPVSFEVVSGPANLSGNRLTVSGPGTILIRAKHNGNANYLPAQSVDRTINSDCGSGFIRVNDKCKPICTSFNYTSYGVCEVNNQQTRSVLESLPAGCVGGSPILNQSCIRVCVPDSSESCASIPGANVTGYRNKCNSLGTGYLSDNTCQISNCNSGFTLVGNECRVLCTEFNYSNWSVCYANNTRTRTILGSTPAGCVGGSPLLVQSCSYNSTLFCQPESIVSCDAVPDSISIGYKNKCDSNGTAYLNQSTCSYRKYVLNRNDLNVSIDSGKKVLRDSREQAVLKIPSVLDNSVFENINILKSNENESKEFLIVKNLELLSGQTKSVLFERKSGSSNAVCIRDEPNLRNAGEIRANCFKVKCPGHVGDYNCAVSGNIFEVSGLRHSGVIEDRLLCGDNLCSEGESCSSCATDCGLCSGVGSNTGGSSSSGSSNSNSNSGSSNTAPIVVDDSSSIRESINQVNSQDGLRIELNGKKSSSSGSSNSQILNYIIAFLIFLAVVILIILVSIFIRSPAREYVPETNNSMLCI